MFGIDYAKAGSLDNMKIKRLFQIIQEENFSKNEFNEALNKFLKTQKYTTWTYSDFLDYKRQEFFTYEQVSKLTNGTIKGYKAVELNGALYYIDENIVVHPPFKLRQTKFKVDPIIKDKPIESIQITEEMKKFIIENDLYKDVCDTMKINIDLKNYDGDI